MPTGGGAPRMTQDIEALRADGGGRPTAAGARWIVSEHSGRWAIGLRREAGASGIRLHETRSLADAWAMLEQHPASFLVAELTRGNALALLDRIAGLERWFPSARVAVVAERSLAEHEWLAREAGAAWFATSPRALRPVVELAARHMQRVPRVPRGLVEQVWDGLPWGRP